MFINFNFKLKGRNLQYVASLLVSTFTATTFMALFWSSPITILLVSKDTPLEEPTTTSEIGWLYILLMLGSVVGNMCLGFLINHFGRKGTLLLMCIPIFISWTMILFGKNIETVLSARFIMGLALNLPIIVSIMYIAEITESAMRGKLSIICLLSAEIGAIITLSVGPVSYHALALIGALIPIFSFATFWFMPESPYFYLRKMRYQEAEASLRRLRDTKDVSEELKQMTEAVEESLKAGGSIGDIFINRNYRKAFFVVLGLKTLQELSGGHFIQANMTEIFKIADTGLDHNMQSLICILIPFPFMFGTSYLVDRFGRKPLLYISTVGTSLSMLIEAIYFFLRSSGSSTKGIAFLPITGIFLSYIFKGIGIGSIPVLIMSELFPTNIKGHASGIILVYGSVLGTLMTFGFLYLTIIFGLDACFLFFAVCCIAGLVFTIFYVPETKGKSLAEIHKEF